MRGLFQPPNYYENKEELTLKYSCFKAVRICLSRQQYNIGLREEFKKTNVTIVLKVVGEFPWVSRRNPT